MQQPAANQDAAAVESGFLPPFANKENKQLNSLVKQLEKELELTDVSLEEHKDRISVLQEHLSSVQQELQYTQSRLNAKVKELDSEGHLKQLAKREAVWESA